LKVESCFVVIASIASYSGLELQLVGCSPTTPASGGKESVKTYSKTWNIGCTVT
jgi:hypothetical protein